MWVSEVEGKGAGYTGYTYGALGLGIVGGWGGICGWDIRVEVGRMGARGGVVVEGWKRVGEAWDGGTERSLAFPGRGNEEDPWFDLLFLCTQYTARLLISHACSRIYMSSRRDLFILSLHRIVAYVCFSRLP